MRDMLTILKLLFGSNTLKMTMGRLPAWGWGFVCFSDTRVSPHSCIGHISKVTRLVTRWVNYIILQMILLKTLIKLPFTSPLLPQGSRECLALRKNKCRHYRLFSSSSCRICSLFTQYPDTRLSKNNAEELLGAVLVPPSSKVPFHNGAAGA